MTTTTTYHVSNLGSMAGDVRPDMDGYVHLTAEAVRSGNWDDPTGELTAEDSDQAEEIAQHNREATEAAEAAIDEWRHS